MNQFLSLLTQSSGQASGIEALLPLVIMLAAFGAIFYFMIFRPQAKQEKKQQALLASLEIGDSVLTASGFYGVIIDMVEGQDIVIVEFGNNKNCRIPMKKSAVVEVEKSNAQ
ncbi:MAG: preprotein translocase subunit YajC [Lachnospiraceae bacterium]|nr:preprotein translocase subunit YajC [Lachnospiraceae bacterium]